MDLPHERVHFLLPALAGPNGEIDETFVKLFGQVVILDCFLRVDHHIRVFLPLRHMVKNRGGYGRGGARR